MEEKQINNFINAFKSQEFVLDDVKQKESNTIGDVSIKDNICLMNEKLNKSNYHPGSQSSIEYWSKYKDLILR